MLKIFFFSVLALALVAPGVAAQPAETVTNVVANTVSAPAQPAPISSPSDGRKSLIAVLDFQSTDILAALTQLEEKSGSIISPEPDVQGKVTITLRNISLWDALKIILDSNNLAYYQEGDIIKVMTAPAFAKQYGHSFDDQVRSVIVRLKYADPAYVLTRLNPLRSALGRLISTDDPKTFVLIDDPKTVQSMLMLLYDLDVPVETQVYQLRYAAAPEVAEKIKGTLSRNIGQVNFDDRTNQVVITDTAENIRKATTLITSIDQQKEVLVDTEVLAIDLNDEHKDGVDWEAIISDYASLQEKKNVENVLAAGGPAAKKLSFGTLSHEDYDILKDALEVVGEMKSYPAPNVSVVDDGQAYLGLTMNDADVVMEVVSPVPKSADSAATDDKKFGFYVTPKVHLDGNFSIKIKPKLPGISGEIPIELRTDEVAIIGGIFTEKQIAQTNRFPILGSLPIVGFVFRSQTTDIRKTEYIIFIKPKLVSPSDKGR